MHDCTFMQEQYLPNNPKDRNICNKHNVKYNFMASKLYIFKIWQVQK